MTLARGTRVRMSEAYKAETRVHSPDHVAEFADCVGIVDGPVDYNDGVSPFDPSKLGPEVDVRWQPSRLRYGYDPKDLVVLPMIIAIDGPAASGKGTIARRIAEHFGYACLDTGLLYRAVAREVLARGGALEDEALAADVARSLDPARLDAEELRLPGVGEAASVVARQPAVRAALLEFQRAFARRPPGAVLDGRDIGTVVCPDADVKIFITAEVEVRARRRYEEQKRRGEAVELEKVLEIIRRRDERDAGRPEAPMKPADDAILLDTTNLDIEAAFNAAIGLIKRKISQ